MLLYKWDIGKVVSDRSQMAINQCEKGYKILLGDKDKHEVESEVPRSCDAVTGSYVTF